MAGQTRRSWLPLLAAVLPMALGLLPGCIPRQVKFPEKYGGVVPLNSGRHGAAPHALYPGGPVPGAGYHGGHLPTSRQGGQQVIQAAYQTATDNDELLPYPRQHPTRGHADLGSPTALSGPMLAAGPKHHPVPGEKRMVSHPPYKVAPPDILVIDAVRLIPKPPYRIQPLEVLLIDVQGTLPNRPIAGTFTVSPEGTINLGADYGSVDVGGLTLDEIQTAIANKLSNVLRNPQVSVALAQFRGLQQIRGQHLVRQDGTIGLGTYGSVYVAGMALGQAKHVIEKHLSHFLLDPEISVDVFAYNSKFYYVILDGGGFGQQVIRLPITGNETVLDAISNIQGLAPVSSKKRIWLARPGPPGLHCNQILPVDWNAITQGGSTATNYQIFPGDRIYVSADRLIAIDNWLSKIITPIERIFGVIFLGSSTVNSFSNGGSDLGFVAF